MPYKPEWIKWRYHKNQNNSKSLVYQLLEGHNYLFEDLSADLIKFVLNTESWSLINQENIYREFPDIPVYEINSFMEQLLDNGILIDYVPNHDEILLLRNKVGQHRIDLEKSKDVYSESEIKKKLPFFQSDPESEYASFLEHDRIPSVVMFELTYNCNEMCVHCFNPGAARNDDEKSLRNKRVEIDIEHYSSLLKDLDEMGVYKIILTGGDPFVKPKIWQLIEMISKTNIVIDIYTNGLALLGRIERLANHWPLSIGLSIYSADDIVHNSITRVPNSLRKSLIVASDIVKFGIPLYFKCPIMTHNAKSYYKVAELARDYGAIPQIDVSLTDAIDGDVTITENLQVKGDLLNIILRDPDVPIYVGKEVPDFGRQVKNKNEAFCGAGTVMMNITPEGDVTPCNSFPTQFGNLRDTSFKEIIRHNKKLKKWQDIVIEDYDECGTHEKCNFCSRCPGQSFIEHGTPLKASSANCNMAVARMNLASLLKNGDDPLKGKSVKDALDQFESNVNSRVISKKTESYRNKELF